MYNEQLNSLEKNQGNGSINIESKSRFKLNSCKF